MSDVAKGVLFIHVFVKIGPKMGVAQNWMTRVTQVLVSGTFLGAAAKWLVSFWIPFERVPARELDLSVSRACSFWGG